MTKQHRVFEEEKVWRFATSYFSSGGLMFDERGLILVLSDVWVYALRL